MYKIYEAIRDARGMTDYEVAKKAQIATSTLSAWKHEGTEKGYTPKIDKIKKIADALGVPYTVFFGKEKNEDNSV